MTTEFDALHAQQARQHQAGGPGPDNADLCAHGAFSRFFYSTCGFYRSSPPRRQRDEARIPWHECQATPTGGQP